MANMIDLTYSQVSDSWGIYAIHEKGTKDEIKDYNRAKSFFTDTTRVPDASTGGFNIGKSMIDKSGIVNKEKLVRRAKAFLYYGYQRGMTDTNGNITNASSRGTYGVINNINDPYALANIRMLDGFRGILQGAKYLGMPFSDDTIEYINKWARAKSGVDTLLGRQTKPKTIADDIIDIVKAHNKGTKPINIFED